MYIVCALRRHSRSRKSTVRGIHEEITLPLEFAFCRNGICMTKKKVIVVIDYTIVLSHSHHLVWFVHAAAAAHSPCCLSSFLSPQRAPQESTSHVMIVLWESWQVSEVLHLITPLHK